MKNLIIDLDGTLTLDEEGVAYEEKRPNAPLIEKLRIYQKNGFKITIFTSRGMRSFGGDVAKITAELGPQILSWLDKHAVPYDELVVGKAWCGFEGFYVDDRAVRPSEFVRLSVEEIHALLEGEKSWS